MNRFGLNLMLPLLFFVVMFSSAAQTADVSETVNYTVIGDHVD